MNAPTRPADYRIFCKNLIVENPGITPSEMCHNMHLSHYPMTDCAGALHQFFQEQTADSACRILLDDFFHPLFEKSAYQSAMVQAGYAEKEVEAALAKHYPADTNRYALKLTAAAARPSVAQNACFNFGYGDFTVEAWIQGAGSGTVISKKGGPGGSGNGGFLLVVKPSGSIKFATDDGLGFYEINSAETTVLDGSWHHVLAARKDSELSLYLDFRKLEATPRTDRFPRLNVTNSLRLLVGGTDQWQEEYNAFAGQIGEVRVWDAFVTYENASRWGQTDWITPHLCGCWSFFGRKADDCSPQRLSMSVPPDADYVSWRLPQSGARAE